MSEPSQEHERIERLLKASRLEEPSEALKERVTKAAKAVWDQAPADVPWQIPVWRLAVSAAAATIIIAFGNHLGDSTWSGAQPNGPVAASVSSTELEELAEMVYGPSRSRLDTSRRGGPAVHKATLRDKAENVRQMLDEMDNSGIQAQPAPGGERSRLLRSRLHLGSYS